MKFYDKTTVKLSFAFHYRFITSQLKLHPQLNQATNNLIINYKIHRPNKKVTSHLFPSLNFLFVISSSSSSTPNMCSNSTLSCGHSVTSATGELLSLEMLKLTVKYSESSRPRAS